MSMLTVAYARRAYKSFSRSARHITQLIASHQTLDTGWAYVGYDCLADESSLTPRRVMQLVAFLEANHALEVRRGHGRGHVNFYRVLREEDGKPIPHAAKKVKSAGDEAAEKVKFPTPPTAEKVKSETPNSLQSLKNVLRKEVKTKRGEAGEGARMRDGQAELVTPTAGEAPPTTDISTPEAPSATPVIAAEPSLSEASDERIHVAWQPTPALEAEARARGYYAVLGEGAVADSTTAFRDYYDGQTLRPTRWLKWVGDDARKHPDWPRARAQQRAAAAPPALESWQQPAPDRVPPQELQDIVRGYKYRHERRRRHEREDPKADEGADRSTDDDPRSEAGRSHG